MMNRIARSRPGRWALSMSLLAACSDDGAKPERGDNPGGRSNDAGPTAPMGNENKDGAAPHPDGSLAAAGADAAAAHGTNLPHVTPLVRSAAPPGLGGASALRIQPQDGRLQGKLQALDSVDLKSRFFTEGPTSIYRLLAEVDARIDEINMRSLGSTAPCLSQPPVRYDVSAFGQSIPFYAQCSLGAGPSSFLEFGEKDGVIYLYVAGGVQHAAVRLTREPLAAATDAGVPGATDAGAAAAPDAGEADAATTAPGPFDAGTASGTYRVDAWMGLGYNNATSCGPMRGFDGCSYGVIELHADPTSRLVELSVAGVGFGYCGAQLRADATNVFARGSIDMGMTCLSTSELCVAASDVTTPAVCSAGLTKFVSPALGRKATVGSQQSFGESQYPGSANNQITLDGSATDSLALGPIAPADGVGSLVGAGPGNPP
ncbi:MAG: hypothetical protein JWN48_1102 [Myxococcaceae bacterium]|nr:hypothetical protein [Myxococcaceae bacterium]